MGRWNVRSGISHHSIGYFTKNSCVSPQQGDALGAGCVPPDRALLEDCASGRPRGVTAEAANPWRPPLRPCVPCGGQPIGWHPDLNDGVRLNIRPFMEADVLRKRPNIKWGKDRGKNPPGSPWGEERDNDRHLTLAEKQAARGT